MQSVEREDNLAGSIDYLGRFDSVGERFGIAFCITTTEDVEVVGLALHEDQSFPVQLAGVETPDGPTGQLTGVAGPMEPTIVNQSDDASALNGIMWLEVQRCVSSVDTWTTVDSVTIDYRYRGRMRSTAAPLGTTYGFGPVVDCGGVDSTSPRRQDADTHDAWVAQVSEYHPAIAAAPEGDGVGISEPEVVGRDLCLYLAGPTPVPGFPDIEPIENRRVFQLEDAELASEIVEAALNAICPEYANQADRLTTLIDR